MMNNGTAGTADERSPWTQPGFIAAAAVVAIIVVLGLVIVVTGRGSDSQAQNAPAASPPASPAAPSPSADPNVSACGLPAGSQEIPATTPRTRWELVGQVAAPTAPESIGPARVDGGFRSCFAHSPIGALYAAVNAIAMTAAPKQREEFIRKLTRPGVGRDRALAELGRSSDVGNASTTLQVQGFRITDYRKGSAVVDLAFRVASGAQAGSVHLPLALRWRKGDWNLALPDTGQPFDGMARLASMSDYVPWNGA